VTVPIEIAERLRRPTPAEAATSVIAGSLPVISFGDAFRARVATIALNPSWAEFQKEVRNRSTGKKERIWLQGPMRRLASRHSMGLTSDAALTDDQVEAAYDDCVTYFRRKPYSWFKSLNQHLTQGLSADYYDGTACHLDLVQWATGLPQGPLQAQRPEVWARLVEEDATFLRWQLATTAADTFVINGKHVRETLVKVGLIPEMEHEVREFATSTGRSRKVSFLVGESDGKRYYSWNVPADKALSKEARQWIVSRLVHYSSEGGWSSL